MRFLLKAWGKILGGLAIVVVLGEAANLLFRLGIQRWVIPNWILLLALVLLILTVAFLANSLEEDLRKKGPVPQEEFDKLKKEFTDYKTGLSKSVGDLDQKLRDQQAIVADIYNKTTYDIREAEGELQPKDEVLTVLGLSAGNASRHTTRSSLNVLYEETYKGKGQADLNVLIAKLEDCGLIELSGDWRGEELVLITPKGLKYFDAHRNRDV